MAGVWGCPPDTISTPFLVRKGVGGWSKRIFQHPAKGTTPVKRTEMAPDTGFGTFHAESRNRIQDPDQCYLDTITTE